MAMIKLENVNKSFGDLHVLKDVNLEVEEGEKLVIIGPSGSGKSTTVRCMNFLEAPSSGHVYIDGTELTSKNKTKVVRESTSMVFQQFNLYPHMTVLKNLTLAPMKLHHKPKKEAEELRNMTGAEETLTLGDNDRNKTDYCYTECDQIVRKLHHQFYFKRREKAYEQCKPAKTYR